MPRFLFSAPWDNVAPSAQLWTMTAAPLAGYSPYWVADLRAERPSRCNTTACMWQATFSVPRRIDLVGFIAPMVGAGYSLVVQGSNFTDFSSPPLNIVVTSGIPWPDSGQFGTGPETFKNKWIDLRNWPGYTPAGYQYWRFGSPESGRANFGIGEIWLSSTVREFKYGPQRGNHKIMTRQVITHMTERGVRLSYDRGSMAREFDFQFRLPSGGGNALDILTSWFSNAQGSTMPSLIVPDDTEEECYMVVWDEAKLPWVREIPGMNLADVRLRELTSGILV